MFFLTLRISILCYTVCVQSHVPTTPQANCGVMGHFVTLEPPPYPADLAERVAELDGIYESVAKLSALGVHMNLLPVVLICL